MSMLALALLAQSAFGVPPAASYDGQCIYAPGLGEPRGGEVRVTCDQVVTDAGGIDFRSAAWDARMMRFAGNWEGDRLTVTSIVPRSGSPVEVRGLCRRYYANQQVSVIACTAVAGGRSWIANFRVTRI